MVRYKLRTLMIVLALGPPLLAGLYFWWKQVFEWTITGMAVVIASFAVFYAVVLVGMLAHKWWETYWRPNRH
jgi:hypothetical protein